MDTLGERIRSVRGKRSREEFSREYSIHPQSLGRYENNARTPENTFLHKISVGEGISFDWIKFGTGPTQMDKSTPCQNLYQDRDLRPCEFSQSTEIIDTTPCDALYHDRGTASNELLPHYLKALDATAALQRELTDSIRENADLRVELERRKAQLRDLERENADLRKAMKPARLSGMDGQSVA